MDRLADHLQRVTVVTGGFGSGKTEFALNLALGMVSRAKPSGKTVALADLDIINPYFRTREASSWLEAHDIKPVVPSGDVFHSDLPVYGPGIINLLQQNDVYLILDVGGDEMGATALAGIASHVAAQPHRVLMVVNPYRPFTRNVEEICRMARGIQERSRLAIHAFISNPNLSYNTTLHTLAKGHTVVLEAAEKLGVPVLGILLWRKFFQAWQDQLSGLSFRVPVIPIDIYLAPGWLKPPTAPERSAHRPPRNLTVSPVQNENLTVEEC